MLMLVVLILLYMISGDTGVDGVVIVVVVGNGVGCVAGVVDFGVGDAQSGVIVCWC